MLLAVQEEYPAEQDNGNQNKMFAPQCKECILAMGCNGMRPPKKGLFPICVR